MSSSRNLRWVVLLVLVGLLAGAGILWIRRSAQLKPAPQSSKKEIKPMANDEVKIVGEVRKLVPGKAIEDELSALQAHVFEMGVQAGQYVHIDVEQKGIDVAVKVRSPEGGPETYVDSPTGSFGPEHFYDVSKATGSYNVEVMAEDPVAAPGKYQISAKPLNPATDIDRTQVEAWMLFNEGEKLRRLHKNKARRHALEKYGAALGLWRTLPESREWAAQALYRIGWIHQELYEQVEALSPLREGESLFQALGKEVEEGLARTRIGEVELRLGHPKEAVKSQQRALELFLAKGRADLAAGASCSLGKAYHVSGKIQEALDSYRSAVDQARIDGNCSDQEAAALQGIGEVFIAQGKLASALDSLQQSLAIDRQRGDLNEAADVLSRMATAALRDEKLNQALGWLNEALEIRRSVQDRGGEAMTLNSVGTVYLLRGEMPQAKKTFTRALTLFRQTENRYGEAFALLNLGRCRFEEGNLQRSLRDHDKAAAIFHDIGYLRGEASTLYGSARALHGLGDYEGARQRLGRVIDNVEAVRGQSENQDLKTSFFATKQHYYELYIDVLMHLHEKAPKAGHDGEALELNERRRARSLLELLGGSSEKNNPKIDPKLLHREQEVQQQISALAEEQFIAREMRRDSQLPQLDAEQRVLLADLADVQARIRLADPAYAVLAHPEPLKLSEMKTGLLDSSSLLLVYSLGDERSFLWLLRPDGGIVSASLPSRGWLESSVKAIRKEWGPKQRDRRGLGTRLAAQLSKEILDPVAKELKAMRLVVVADGALESIPFAALPDPRTLPKESEPKREAAPLVARHEIVHLPSVSALALLRWKMQNRVMPSPGFAVLADPVFTPDDSRVLPPPGEKLPEEVGTADPDLDRAIRGLGLAGLERLTFSRTEAESIASLFPPQVPRRVKLDFEASREEVEDPEIGHYQFLHIATHGLMDSEHPELSGLVMSLVDAKGNRRKGFLLAHEICNLNLSADLVVLSACETGIGSEVQGEGIMGLTRSFMYAGAPRVVVSLWNVNDKATSELMLRFYRGFMTGGLTPAAALRCAQLSIRSEKKWASPYYWAPFILQGEWRAAADSSGPPIERQVVKPGGNPVPDDDYPPPGSPCPDLL